MTNDELRSAKTFVELRTMVQSQTAAQLRELLAQTRMASMVYRSTSRKAMIDLLLTLHGKALHSAVILRNC